MERTAPPQSRHVGKLPKKPVDITAVPEGAQYYELDNSLLRSKSDGIHLRKNPSILDNDLSTPLLKWGTVLRAKPFSSGGARDNGAVQEAQLAMRDVYGRSVQIQQEPSEWLLVTGVRNLRGRFDGVTKKWFVPCDIAGVPMIVQRNDVHSDVEQEEEELQRPGWGALPEPEPGPEGKGMLYQVVFEKGVVVRAEPRMTAMPLSREPKGAIVELYDWDPSCHWRLVHDRQSRKGWMMLDHPDLGPLLRPRSLPFQVRPVEPLVAAALEGSLRWLRHFINEGVDPNVRDAGGRTPFMVASEFGRHSALIVLAAAGAATAVKSDAGHTALALADTPKTKALVLALDYKPGEQPFDAELCLEAIDGLDSEVKELAEDLLSKKIAKVKFFGNQNSPEAGSKAVPQADSTKAESTTAPKADWKSKAKEAAARTET